MELNKEVALNIAMQRIMALEDELVYAKAIAEQLRQELEELKEQMEGNNEQTEENNE